MINDPLQIDLDKYYSYGADNFVRYTHRLRINRIGKLITDISLRQSMQSPLRALDAGCSHGIYSTLLAQSGYDVVGIDINEYEIGQAREWARARDLQRRIAFHVGDIQKIDAEDSTFDIIVCSEVLEHLDRPASGASELLRVLKPNCRAIISMPNMGCLF